MLPVSLQKIDLPTAEALARLADYTILPDRKRKEGMKERRGKRRGEGGSISGSKCFPGTGKHERGGKTDSLARAKGAC